MPARFSDLLSTRIISGGLSLLILLLLVSGCASPEMKASADANTNASIITPAATIKTTAIEPGATVKSAKDITPAVKQASGSVDKNPVVATAFIDITPYTNFDDRWSSGKGSDNEQTKIMGGDFSDCYTRLLISSDVYADGKKTTPPENGNETSTQPNDIGEYSYKPRSWLARALLGKEFSLNFTTNVVVGSLEETIPLVTIGHASNSDGEKWSRVIYHNDQSHPLFLVKGSGNNAIPKITVTMHGSKSYASRGAASALQVVFSAVNAISPTLPIATTLSAQSSKNRANALDAAISKLFGTDVKEEHSTSHDFRFWSEKNGQPNGINVTLSVPYPGENWASDDNHKTAKEKKGQVGTWTIAFDYPRPSIFSDWRICGKGKEDEKIRCMQDKQTAQQRVIADIDASEVLNYDLLNDGKKLGTIRSFLLQQEWFNQAQTKLVAASTKQAKTKNAVKTTATQMCRSIRNSITGLNLNGFDANIVVWAVLRGMSWPDDSPTYSDMQEATDCNSITK